MRATASTSHQARSTSGGWPWPPAYAAAQARTSSAERTRVTATPSGAGTSDGCDSSDADIIGSSSTSLSPISTSVASAPGVADGPTHHGPFPGPTTATAAESVALSAQRSRYVLRSSGTGNGLSSRDSAAVTDRPTAGAVPRWSRSAYRFASMREG